MDPCAWLSWPLISFSRRPSVDSTADAKAGGCRRHGPCWQFPWHSRPMWATLTWSDSADSFSMFPPQWQRNGKREALNRNFAHQRIGQKKKNRDTNAKTHLPPVWINIKGTNGPWPFLQNNNKEIILLWGWLCQTFLQFWWGTVSQ